MIFDLFITLLYFYLNLYEFTRKRNIDFYVQKTLKHVVKFWNEGLDLFLKTEDNFLFFFSIADAQCTKLIEKLLIIWENYRIDNISLQLIQR